MSELVNSYYEASALRPPPMPSLEGGVSADVCVIGGGYTGLSCALELAIAGKSVVLLESSRIGWGASGRNGGQMIYGYSTDNLASPAKQGGVSEKYLFDLSVKAIDLARQRIKQYGIECDFKSGYMLAALHQRHYRELQQKVEQLQKKYQYPTRLLDRAQTRECIASRRYCGALVDDNSGHLHPLKYALGLAQAAIQTGVKVYENTPAVSFTNDNNGARIKTPKGEVVSKALTLAGNAYINILPPPLQGRVMPVRTYIGATTPLDAKVADNLIANGRAVCDMNFILDYFRVSADKRLLFGGRVSYSNRAPAHLTPLMRRRMTAVFPQMTDVSLEYAWGGSVAITVSRFPDIGRWDDNIYYAHGFSGHGVAISGFAGKILADGIIGDSERLDVFNRIKPARFVGGSMFRMPMLAMAMMYYRLRDIIG